MRIRSGVSLLEVMFAIGVVGVGLLGVIAVLPLALNQVGRGNMADRSSRVGMNAVAEFDLRGMRAPSTWRFPTGAVVGHPRGLNQAFCIDPRFVAVNGTFNNTIYDASLFPYIKFSSAIVPPPPRMGRVSLTPNPALTTTGIMTAMQADQIFVADDELTFDIPGDETLPPVQVFGDKRESEGILSWMATVTPKIDNNRVYKDTYVLSVVVFNRRDASSLGRSQTMFDDINTDGVVDPGEDPTYNERLVWIIGNSSNANAAPQFHGDGFGGGDVTLEAATAAELELNSGDWVMLMQNLRSTQPFTPMFRWYRVADTESPYWDGSNYLEGRPIDRSLSGNSDRPGMYERHATLIGADWPWLSSADWRPDVSGSGRIPVVYATLVTGVVAVYEKTIRLETSSLW